MSDSDDKMSDILWRKMELLEGSIRRFEAMESTVREMRSNLEKIETDHKATKELVYNFRLSVEKLSESTERIKSVDSALQGIREKMINYDNKFQSFEDLKKLVIAGICATIPGTLNGLLEVLKFCLQHKVFWFMLFHDDIDEQLYLKERGSDSHGTFVKRRAGFVRILKDFSKSQQQKRNWKRNKWNIMQGIKQYANSFASKRFHRQLGNFIATRNFIPKNGLLAQRELDASLINLRDNLVNEQNYYCSALDQVFLELLIEDLNAVIGII